MLPDVSDTTRSLLKNHKYILIDGRFDTLAISHKYWERRGFEIIEFMNKLWLETEIIAERLYPYEQVLQLVKMAGTYESSYNAKGAYSIKRVKG